MQLHHKLTDLLTPGLRVLLHAGPAESPDFRAALLADPERASGVTFAGLFIPGLNTFDYASLTPTTRLETLFVSPAMRGSFDAGRLDHLPINYAAYPSFLARHPVDLAILHLPPARNGQFSCGIGADIAEGIQRFARKTVVLANPNIPHTPGGIALAASEAAAVYEVDGALASFPSDAPDPLTTILARHVAGLVRDGDTLQIGIGKVQAAVLRALSHHRNLSIFSGMLIDEVALLAKSGALHTAGTGRPDMTAGIAVGSPPLLDLAASGRVAFHGIDITHNPLRLAGIEHFVSINSALEVDLFGQVNAEMLRGRQISGVGGGGDYMRAARLSSHGRSIIALPSQARGKSRIVPRLESSPISFARTDIDYLVTEQGVAHLRDLSVDARAEAIMGLAAPDHLRSLQDKWRIVRNAL